MARTQAADYDEKRGLITGQAARLFAQKGFSAASLSELASLCGMSKSLIYHYYPSKEAILYDVMSGHIDALLTTIKDDCKTAPKKRVKNFALDLMHHYVGAADKQKVLLYDLVHLPTGQRNEIVGKQRRIIEHAERLLMDVSPESGKDRAELRARIMLFFGMLNWTHTWFKPRGAISRDDIAEMAADTLLQSVA